MNQETILQSNLLDIIFENRNKNYGAYDLRVSYNRRMTAALISTTIICIILCLLSLITTSKVVKKDDNILFVPTVTLAEFHPKEKVAAALRKMPSVNKRSTIEMPPKIVASVNINKLPATPPEISGSLTQLELPGRNSPQPGDEYNPASFAGSNIVNATSKIEKEPKKNIVLESAEVMPEYPGGLKALLLFLKKNIQSPEDVDQGEERLVKIKFVVNYNGKLEGFDVIKSGGTPFDDEVISVLKKMPRWNPGKSNGENVSVYYIVPVKFSNTF